MWFTTTAWMMWNALVSALLLRASIVMLDGNPPYPDVASQWRLAEETRPTLMGASPAFLMACRKAGLEPGRDFDLSSIRSSAPPARRCRPRASTGSTSSSARTSAQRRQRRHRRVHAAIVQGSPLQPVYAARSPAAASASTPPRSTRTGNEVVGELGELVIRQPMPSMPVGFWNDPDGARYRAAYFDEYPGVWRHGDWILFTERGSCVITGRSDATLNRGGVRLGTGEFYARRRGARRGADSLVVHLEDPRAARRAAAVRRARAPGLELDDELRARIAGALRAALSPRHVPDDDRRGARRSRAR